MNSLFLNVLFVGLGGMLGAVSRYLVSIIPGLASPLPVFLVNMLGCFLFGLCLDKQLEKSWSLFLFSGFLGSLTTFSSFEADNYRLFSEGKVLYLLLNIILQVVVGFLVFRWGIRLASK